MRLALVSVLLMAQPAFAELEELGVIGDFVEARPYYEQFIANAENTRVEDLALPTKRRVNEWTRTQPYDSGLKADELAWKGLEGDLAKALHQPICIVANDKISHSWLERNVETLKRVNAVCYLARFRRYDDELVLSRMFDGVRFVAINPHVVIERFHIESYPVLIHKEGIEQ